MKAGVLYVLGSFKSGGTETQLLEILRRLDRKRFEPRVLCFRKEGRLLKEVLDLDVEVRETGFDRLVSVGAWRAMRRHGEWCRRRGVRIVQAFHFHASLYSAILKRGCPEAKLIVCEQGFSGQSRLKKRLGQRFYYAAADVILANCRAVGEEVVRLEGADPRRLRVIYGGVDTDKFLPPAVKRSPGADGPLIGCLGRLHPVKAQELLVEAAPRILEGLPGARFLLVGDGPQRADLESRLAARGLSGRFRLLGDRGDVGEILGRLDLLVLPSRSEGFANALLEGHACGLPIVASSVGGNGEIVSHGETGMLFPSGDARRLAECVVEVLREPGRAREMGEAGRRRIESLFSVAGLVREHEILYEDLLRTSSDAVPAETSAAGRT